MSLKTELNDLSISSIILKLDNPHLKQKVNWGYHTLKITVLGVKYLPYWQHKED